jgi:hypothetical protein
MEKACKQEGDSPPVKKIIQKSYDPLVIEIKSNNLINFITVEILSLKIPLSI